MNDKKLQEISILSNLLEILLKKYTCGLIDLKLIDQVQSRLGYLLDQTIHLKRVDE